MTDSTGTNEPDRRARLQAIKLQALVRQQLAVGERADLELDVAAEAFALGAALIAGDVAWVLIDSVGQEGRGLGAALVWATRRGASSVNIVAEHGSGVLARRAAAFAVPVAVWAIDGRTLRPAVPAHAEQVPEPRAEHLRFVVDIETAGATPLVEYGVVVGEVRGLEVCRVVDVEGINGSESRLDVGVGVHDRKAFAIMHAGVPTRDALANVVASVAAVRDLSVPAHPLNRIAPERYLRWRLEREPWLVDMASVRAAQPPVRRPSLTDRVACTARGERVDGCEVVIVCSVGVDLDVIPYAADARLAAEGEPGVGSAMDGPIDVVVVMPPRDVVAVTKELAGLLCHSVSLVGLPAG